MAGAAASVSRQPRVPPSHTRPFSSVGTWPPVPALDRCPVFLGGFNGGADLGNKNWQADCGAAVCIKGYRALRHDFRGEVGKDHRQVSAATVDAQDAARISIKVDQDGTPTTSGGRFQETPPADQPFPDQPISKPA